MKKLKYLKFALATVTVSNRKFSQIRHYNLSIVPSIKSIQIITNQTVASPGSPYLFNIAFDSLGNPSCTLLQVFSDLSKKSIQSFSIGNDNACKKYNSNNVFRGDYNVYQINNSLNISIVITQSGFFYLDVTVKNEFNSESIRTGVSVSSLDCQRPGLSIIQQSVLYYEPSVFKRSDMISIVSNTQIRCSLSLLNIKKWRIFSIDSSTGQINSEVNLINNPTVNFAELVIQENTLDYGTYKLVYQVQMVGQNNQDLSAFQSSTEHFIKIVSSGLVINAFKDGEFEIRRGINQTIELNPALYSNDLDSIVDFKVMKFRFFCSIMENGSITSEPYSSLFRMVDLATFKANKASIMEPCFNDKSPLIHFYNILAYFSEPFNLRSL